MARVLMLLVATLVAAPSSVAAQQERHVRVGVYENAPKVGFGSTGEPEGIFVDVIEAIAGREGWTLEYVPGSWQEGLGRLERGELDLMPDVAFTAERDDDFAFHDEPVLSSWNQVYAPRGSEIRALPDLAGKRVAVLEGSMQQQQFRTMVEGFDLDVILVPSRSYGTAFQAVVDGDAEAVVTNRYYGIRHAPDAGLVDTAIIFSPSQLYFAAPLGAGSDAEERRWKQLRFDLLDRTLTQEARDASWSRQTEERMLEISNMLGTAQDLRAECGQTLCSFRATHENPFTQSEFISDFVHEIGPHVDGATVMVGRDANGVWSRGFLGRRGYPLPLPPGYTNR